MNFIYVIKILYVIYIIICKIYISTSQGSLINYLTDYSRIMHTQNQILEQY